MVRPLIASFGDQRLRYAELRNGEHVLAQTLVHGAGSGRWTIFAPSQAPVAPVVFDRAIANNPRATFQSLLARLSPAALVLQAPYQDPLYSLQPPQPNPSTAL
jgi:hypothetical protein